jgi:UPF0716 protein FxsA
VLAKLAVLFTVVPLVELYLLMTLGGVLGPGPTIAIVAITGIAGASLARREGTRVWREWQKAVAQGQMPKEGLTSSLLVLIGGVLLVTPGVLTDVTGLALLIPPTRRAIAGWLRNYVQRRFEVQTIAPGISANPDIIDVDAKDSSG